MKRIFLFILGVGLSVLSMAQGGLSSQSTVDRFDEAYDLFLKEKYAVSQHLFDQYVQQADANSDKVADACYYSAVCSERLRNGDAEYRLMEFMRLYPENGHMNMARYFLGNVYFDKNNFGEALRTYLTVEPSEIEYGHKSGYDYKMGYCYFHLGEKEKSKPYFTRVANGKSQYEWRASYYLGAVLYSNGQDASAESEFKRTKSLIEKLEKNLKNKKIKNTEEAKSIRQLKENVAMYLLYTKFHQGKYDEVLRDAPELLKNPDLMLRDEVLRMVGDIYFNRGEGEYERAIKYYSEANEEARRKNKAFDPSWNYPVGYCYYMLGQYDSAATYLSSFVGADDTVAQNALLILGDTYVKCGRKGDARTCFKSAADMNYNPEIREEAAFNYAKLNCELNPNAYNESIRSLDNYLQHCKPTPQHKAEIQQLLTSIYCTTRNYKEALSLIEKNKKELLKDATMRQAYQRILVNRGIDLFNERNLQQAAVCFDTAVVINATPSVTTDALYLAAECQYRLANYGRAQKLLDRFFTASSRKESVYYPQALYTAGYVYMRRKRYSDAEEKFGEFLKLSASTGEHRQVLDAYNRMGDCLYVRKNFNGAIGYYDKVINAKGQDADYAMYQKALSLGAQGKNVEKLNCLNYIFEKFGNSPLSSKAMYEIANTYLICDNNEMASLYYNNFIKKYSQSSFVPSALLNLGLIYYNTEQNDKALETFDQLMTRYPGTDEARDALMTIKNIYVEQDRAEEYFTYVSRTTKGTVSAVEQDSTLYLAAENRYFAGNYENAIAGFSNYIQKFPHGLFILKAHYYLADALTRTEQRDKALTHYEWVAERGNNPYTEGSLQQVAATYYRRHNYRKALEYYVPLVAVASTDGVRLDARMGIVRCWNALSDSTNLRISAEQLLQEPKATDEQRDEARLMLARSRFYADAFESAFIAYEPLLRSANGDYMGEAAYRRAYIRCRQDRLDDAERIIEEVVNNPGSDYWLAKTFVLWADIFHKRGNDVQAQQTLQSIIDNYEVVTDADEEVVMEARQQLRSLQSQSSTDASSDGQKVEDMVIDIDEE